VRRINSESEIRPAYRSEWEGRIRDTGYEIQDTGYRIRDTGYEIQDTRYRIRDTGYEMLDLRISKSFVDVGVIV
jgi:hypothetical protein